MELKFRLLRADEIDCRVSTCTEKGVFLLFYKDARCDMNILDETVGAMNWQREHCRENANCMVSIWDAEKQQWISKEDTGTESNTEKEKGLASDSFKRACFNWGIGRELYTAPFVWVPADRCRIEPGTNGKLTCRDRFVLKSIEYKDGRISGCTVWNESRNCEAFTMGKKAPGKPTEPPKEEPPKEEPPKKPANTGDFVPTCSVCGKQITVTEHDWSVKRYKRPLCRAHQREADGR